jgi:hypothetical protein
MGYAVQQRVQEVSHVSFLLRADYLVITMGVT